MKIYLEYVLIENIVVNYILFSQISIFTKQKIKIKNKIIATLILSIYTLIIYVYNTGIQSSMLLKLLVVNFSVYIAFKEKNIRKYIKHIIYYYLLSFSYVGIIISITLLFNITIEKFYFKIVVYLVSNVILYLFNKFMWKLWKTNIKEDSLTYTLLIGKYKIQAFVDTGNSVHDYIHNLDVFFIESWYYDIFEKDGLIYEKIPINISSINSSSINYGYVLKDIKIKKDNFSFCFDKILLVFVDKKFDSSINYNAIIGYDTYVEKLKGVNL